MNEFRQIRDRFVVQDDHTIRTVTLICALFLLVAIIASLFMARQIYDTYSEVRAKENTVISLQKERLIVQAEIATRTSVQAMATRVKDSQMVPITQTVQLQPGNVGALPSPTPVAGKK
ncbi:MAG: hypothetical protein KIH69_004180 [Anaerolineae bacterium]|nr:hypothetical protein [Anaerolineae bacterium]